MGWLILGLVVLWIVGMSLVVYALGGADDARNPYLRRLLVWGGDAEADEPALPAMERELDQLRERIAELERASGSGGWMTKFNLWQHRRRLHDLARRRNDLVLAVRRQQARRQGVRMPDDRLPARPAAVQAPPVPGAHVRLDPQDAG